MVPWSALDDGKAEGTTSGRVRLTAAHRLGKRHAPCARTRRDIEVYTWKIVNVAFAGNGVALRKEVRAEYPAGRRLPLSPAEVAASKRGSSSRLFSSAPAWTLRGAFTRRDMVPSEKKRGRCENSTGSPRVKTFSVAQRWSVGVGSSSKGYTNFSALRGAPEKIALSCTRKNSDRAAELWFWCPRCRWGSHDVANCWAMFTPARLW